MFVSLDKGIVRIYICGMKHLFLLSIAALLAVNVSARVRSVPPAKATVLQSRYYPEDSVLLVQYLVEFRGKERIVVIREDCGCVVTRKAAVFAFGGTQWRYVRRSEVSLVYELINSK